MRLFITSYQKSGTHQIMPIFSARMKDVVDRSANEFITMPDYLQLNKEVNQAGVKETSKHLQEFSNEAFGHITYLPQYLASLQTQPTKILFNIRDPRDVVIAEYENGLKHYQNGAPERALWNFLDKETNTLTFDKEDVISELIKFASARWVHWLGWLDHSDVLPIKYEELRLNPRETCQRIQEWIAPHPSPNLDIMVNNAQPRKRNPTFRRGVPLEYLNRFEPHHHKLAEKLLGDIITRLGYKV